MAIIRMVASPRSDLRSLLAGVLVALLALTGVGRGLVAGFEPADLRLGAVQPICHTGRDAPGPQDPARSADPDCCAACALLAAAVLPDAPDASRPRSIPVPESRIVAAAFAPEPSRIRTPRQAQGPPAGS